MVKPSSNIRPSTKYEESNTGSLVYAVVTVIDSQYGFELPDILNSETEIRASFVPKICSMKDMIFVFQEREKISGPVHGVIVKAGA